MTASRTYFDLYITRGLVCCFDNLYPLHPLLSGMYTEFLGNLFYIMYYVVCSSSQM